MPCGSYVPMSTPPAQAGGGFFGWVKRVLGGGGEPTAVRTAPTSLPAAPTSAPGMAAATTAAVATAAVAGEAARGRGERGGRGAANGERDCMAIVNAIVALADGLDIETTAEGVETERQAVAMRALDATVETVRPNGTTRSLPIAELHRLPGSTPHIETTLQPGELITAVTLPRPVGGTHIYQKVRDRASYAFAVISVGVIVQPDGSGRVAVGGVAHKPWRIESAETEMARGAKPVSARLFADARPTPENKFKLKLVERTLAAALAQAKGATR